MIAAHAHHAETRLLVEAMHRIRALTPPDSVSDDLVLRVAEAVRKDAARIVHTTSAAAHTTIWQACQDACERNVASLDLAAIIQLPGGAVMTCAFPRARPQLISSEGLGAPRPAPSESAAGSHSPPLARTRPTP